MVSYLTLLLMVQCLLCYWHKFHCIPFKITVSFVFFMQEILYVPLTTAVVALSVTLESATQQTVIIDPVHNSYTVYRGKRLVGTSHCHNIYIRILTRPGLPNISLLCMTFVLSTLAFHRFRYLLGSCKWCQHGLPH